MCILSEANLVRYIGKMDISCNAVPNLKALRSHNPSISVSNCDHGAYSMTIASD